MNSRDTRLAPQSSVASPLSVDLFDGARFWRKRFVRKRELLDVHDPTPRNQRAVHSQERRAHAHENGGYDAIEAANQRS